MDNLTVYTELGYVALTTRSRLVEKLQSLNYDITIDSGISNYELADMLGKEEHKEEPKPQIPSIEHSEKGKQE